MVATLYKMAGGNLSNLTAFIGIIMGSMAYAELHPFWSSFNADTVILHRVLLSEVTPKGEALIVAFSIVSSALVLLRWKRQGKLFYRAYAEGYLQPWKASIIIAVLNTAVYVFSGWPMGITTAFAKIGAYLENLFVPSHAAGVLYFNQDSVTVTLLGTTMRGGAAPETDIIFSTELALIFGIIAGAFLTAVALREFRIYGLPPKRQVLSAFIGGMLMGLGARIASGCNLKFVMGALPLFAFQGIVFVIVMVLGSFFGSLILKRLVLKPQGG